MTGGGLKVRGDSVGWSLARNMIGLVVVPGGWDGAIVGSGVDIGLDRRAGGSGTVRSTVARAEGDLEVVGLSSSFCA